MNGSRHPLVAVAVALLVGVSTPCAAALMPAPAACAMEGCGDGLSVAPSRAACCCSPDAAPAEGGPAASAHSWNFVGGLVQPFRAALDTAIHVEGPGGFTAQPPSPVPLYLLHSALLN